LPISKNRTSALTESGRSNAQKMDSPSGWFRPKAASAAYAGSRPRRYVSM
jgi:hypothetical protein